MTLKSVHEENNFYCIISAVFTDVRIFIYPVACVLQYIIKRRYGSAIKASLCYTHYYSLDVQKEKKNSSG